MGAILASNGIGGAIAMQIVSPIIESGPVGYKRAYFLIAIILVVLFVLMAIFFKNKPKNAEVDTEQTADNSAPKKKSRGDSWVGIGWSDVVKKWWFYLALVSIFLTGMCLQGVTGVSAAHMKDVGIDGAFVATVLSIHSIALACAKFLTGFIYDKCGLRTTVTMCAALSSIVMIALALITNTTTGMVIAVAYGILASFALPLETIVLPIYASDLFGEKSYAKILGVVVAANVSGYAVGAPLVNLCFDISGSYNVAFYICAGIMALVVVSLQILISAARKEKNKILNSVGATDNQDLEIDIQQESNDGNN
jgi:OFA family oxalate/formate antiporter-like MFS transporter